MSDMYMEHLVKKKKTAGDYALRALIIIVIVLSVAAGIFINTILFFVTFGLWALASMVVFPATDLEYEYLYCDKQLTVDKILGKQRRKRVAEYQLDQMKLVVPANSYRLAEYKNKNLKTVNLWSLDDSEGKVPYVIIYSGNQKIILDLPTEFVKIVQNNAPRKVFFD